MEHTHDKLIKKGYKIYSMGEYLDEFFPTNKVCAQALRYQMDEGYLDFIRLGTQRFVVIKDGVNPYSPHPHKNRHEG